MSQSPPTVPAFWLPAPSDGAAAPPSAAPRRRRVLVGKIGLDGHDRGAKYVAQLLRDAGYDVVYTGIRRTPEQIVTQAIRADVDAIGLSVLSGAHNELFAQVLKLLAERGAGEVAVCGGGVIPEDDAKRLTQLGVRAVFTPGTSGEMILTEFDRVLSGIAR